MNRRAAWIVIVVVCVAGAGVLAARPRSITPAPQQPKAPSPVASLPKPAEPVALAEQAFTMVEPVQPEAERPQALAPNGPRPPDPPLDAITLKNTAWASGKFRIDLSPDGNVVIGNSSRAKWKVEGDRLKLYSDTSDEVHYLDIRGSKLYWEGQEIGRAK